MNTQNTFKSLAFCLVSVAFSAQADAIDDFVKQRMKDDQIPGLALAVIEDGKPPRLQGYGFANIEYRVPVHEHTVFQTASLGKMFTATGPCCWWKRANSIWISPCAVTCLMPLPHGKA